MRAPAALARLVLSHMPAMKTAVLTSWPMIMPQLTLLHLSKFHDDIHIIFDCLPNCLNLFHVCYNRQGLKFGNLPLQGGHSGILVKVDQVNAPTSRRMIQFVIGVKSDCSTLKFLINNSKMAVYW